MTAGKDLFGALCQPFAEVPIEYVDLLEETSVRRVPRNIIKRARHGGELLQEESAKTLDRRGCPGA